MVLVDLDYLPEDEPTYVKVCVGKTSDGTILIVYGHPSMAHEDILKEVGPAASRGGDSIQICKKDGAITMKLMYNSSMTVGPLHSEFYDTTVEEFKKLLHRK